MTAAALASTSEIIGPGATKSGSSIRLIPAMYPRRIVSRSSYRSVWSTPVGATPDSLNFLPLLIPGAARTPKTLLPDAQKRNRINAIRPDPEQQKRQR